MELGSLGYVNEGQITHQDYNIHSTMTHFCLQTFKKFTVKTMNTGQFCSRKRSRLLNAKPCEGLECHVTLVFQELLLIGQNFSFEE